MGIPLKSKIMPSRNGLKLHLCKQHLVLFYHFQLWIRKPDLPFTIEDKSKANEGSIFSNGYGGFIPHPVMGSPHHVFWPQSLFSPTRPNVETSLLFNLFDFDLTGEAKLFSSIVVRFDGLSQRCQH